jgi:hypothetical protein
MSVVTPIKFEEERSSREKVIIQSLTDIRKAQIEFRKQNNRYTGSLDTLKMFVEQGNMPVIRKEGVLTDEQLESGLTEQEAVAQGIIIRDTSFVNIKSELFGEDFDINNLIYVPFGNGEKFEMASGSIPTSSGAQIVQVFEAKTPYKVYLSNMDRQEVINLVDRAIKLQKYPGLQVGSIEVANNNAGNWE